MRNKNFFGELRSAMTTIKNTDDERRYNALKEMYDYVVSGVWLKNGSSKLETIRAMFLNIKKGAERLGITENSFNVNRKRMSDKLYSIFGTAIITDIAYGKPEEFIVSYKKLKMIILEKNAKTIFRDDVLMLVDESKCEYLVEELGEELAYLRTQTKQYLVDEFNNYNSDKLSFIVAILSNNSVDTMDLRFAILKEILKN